jgi:PleD family two-component response regulator
LEDDAKNLLKDEEILAAVGYEPVGCTDVADVYAMFREAPERFDVVIVGHLAAATARLEVAAALHEIAPRVAILLASSSADDLDANALVRAGVSDVVHWPIITAEVAAALQECLRHRPTGKSRSRAIGALANSAVGNRPSDRHRRGLARYHATSGHPTA